MASIFLLGILTGVLTLCGMTSCNLLQNDGFESGKNHWDCFGFTCEVLNSAQSSHSGSHSLRTHGRTHSYQGPSQNIHVTAGKNYNAQSWVKILNDKAGTLGQSIQLEVAFNFQDNSNRYINVAMRPLVTMSDGWVFLSGEFQAPHQVRSAKFYYQGPVPGVDFAVDGASITEVTEDSQWRAHTDSVIESHRKSDINVQ